MNMHLRHLPMPATSIDGRRYVDASFHCSHPWEVAHSAAWGGAGPGDGMTGASMRWTSTPT
jgi:hypothetical protein